MAKLVADDLAHIIVSTDSHEIAQVAQSMGIDVPYMRPDYLATDTAGSREVIIDAMDWADRQGIEYDCVVLLQPTSPMREAQDVDCCLDAYRQHADADMAVTVTVSDANPYYNLFEADPHTGYLHLCMGNGGYTRRQDAPKVYEYNGAVYVIRPESIRRMPLSQFPRIVPVEMPPERSIDLDTPLDWQKAEWAIRQKTDSQTADRDR